MGGSKRWLLIGVAVVLAAVLALVWRDQQKPPVAPPVAEATGAPAAAPAMKTTGNYSDDWMTNCGPLSGTAQRECEARLDAAYGKTDATPVPKRKDP